jgi:hypothetical protein
MAFASLPAPKKQETLEGVLISMLALLSLAQNILNLASAQEVVIGKVAFSCLVGYEAGA